MKPPAPAPRRPWWLGRPKWVYATFWASLFGLAGVVAGATFPDVLLFGVLPGVILGLWKGDEMFDLSVPKRHGL